MCMLRICMYIQKEEREEEKDWWKKENEKNVAYNG